MTIKNRIISATLALTMVMTDSSISVFANEEANLSNAVATSDNVATFEPYIIGELTELRSEYTKTYEKSDGSRVSIMSSTPLHYYDAKNKEWEEYDNTLSEAKNEQGEDVLTTNNSVFNVEIPETLDEDNDITIKSEDYEVSLLPLEVSETDVKENDISKEDKGVEEKTVDDYVKECLESPTVSFEDAYSDGSLEYEVANNSLKETISLSRVPNQETSYSFEIKANGLKAELKDEGSVLLKSKDDTVFTIPAPYMLDSNNSFSDDIVTELTENEDSYTLTYIPSMEWLSNEDRAYPVYIDPTITVSDLTSVEDAYVTSGNPNNNYGDKTQLNVGFVEENNVITKEYLSYIKFTDLPENIWNNSYITKAELNLGLIYANNAQINVLKVTSDWDEDTVTYNTRPNTSDVIIDYLDTTNIDDYAQSWDITNLVEEWYDNPDENYGLMLQSPNAGTLPKMIYSSDYTGIHPPGNMYLTIEYASMSNAAYANSRDINVGRAGTVNINDFSGNLRLTRSDIGFDGNIMPVNISMIYDQNNANLPSGFNTDFNGVGFRTNYSQLISYNAEREEYTYIGEDARPIYFEKQESEGQVSFIDKAERGCELSVTGTVYNNYNNVVITDSNGYNYFFDDAGRLIKIADMNLSIVKEANVSATSVDNVNGIINISYNAGNTIAINQITDGVGRLYQFNYSNDKLSSISYYGTTNDALRTVSYTYNNDGYLTSVTYPDNKNVSYQWTNDKLTKVINTDGYNFVFTYTNENLPRVSTIKEYAYNNTLGEDISVTYATDKTTYTDNNTDKQEILQFDKYANLLTSQNSNGYVLVNKYGNNEATASSIAQNQLVNSYGYQKNEINLLSNTRALNGNIGWNGTQVDTEEKLFGTQSLKLSGRDSSSSQSVNLVQGQTYVFSAYVKTKNVTGTFGSTGATIKVDSENITLISYAKYVSGKQEWTRIATTFKANSDCTAYVTLELKSNNNGAEAYFDGMQLEKGTTVSNYSYVLNPDFVNNDNWYSDSTMSNTAPTLASQNSVYCYSTVQTPFDNKCVKLFGDIRYENSVYQEITDLNGQEGDTYTFSGWAKANAANIKDDRSFGLKVEFYNGADLVGGSQTLSFNHYVNDWQYNASSAIAERDYDKIVIYAIYDHQVNYALFDRLNLQLDTTTVNNDSSSSQSSSSGESSSESQSSSNLSSAEDSVVTDSHGREIEYTDENGVKTITEYDDYDNVTRNATEINSLVMQSLQGYTADGNYKTSDTNVLGNTTTYDYNSQLGLLEEAIDPEGNSVEYEYNNAKGVSWIFQDTLYNSYNYDSGDRLTQIKSCNRLAYNFNYNTFGALEGIALGNNDLVGYTYDDKGLLTKTEYANGQSVNYSYDETGNKVGIISCNQEKYDYYYDDFGKLLSAKDIANGIVTFYSEDKNGTEYIQERNNNNNLVHSYYKSNDSLLEYSNGSTKETIYTTKDSADNPLINWNRTSWLSNNLGTYYNVKNTTDEFGRLSTQEIYEAELSPDKQTESNKCSYLTKSYEYNTTNNGVNQSEQVSKITYDNCYDLELNYTYDDNGNIVSDGVYNYEYDDLNRLYRVTEISSNTMTTYYYNYYGNMVSVLTQNGLTSSSVPLSYSGNRVVSYNQNPITYDAIGNPLSYYNGTQFTWGMGRQLESAKLSDNTQINYYYNADGIRTKKEKGNKTTTYTLIGNKITGQSDGTNTFYFRYDDSDNLVGFEHNGEKYFYVTNLLGDIIAILDSDGDCVVEYGYNPWGICTIVSDTTNNNLGNLNPFRYRGYYYDEDTGLYYLQSRYYDPVTMKFLNADDPLILYNTPYIPLEVLTYDYCLNNPMNSADYTGYCDVTSSKTKSKSGYTVKTTISTFFTTLKYKYKVTNDGKIKFPFAKCGDSYWSVVWRGLGSCLSREMISVVRSINKNYLKGRTTGGVNAELLIHYALWKCNIKTKHTEIADIGAIGKKNKGYDSNAWVFEGAGAFVLYKKIILNGCNFAKSAVDIIKYI